MVISGTLSRGKNCVVRDEKYSKFWKTYNSELPSSDYQKPSCSLADVKADAQYGQHQAASLQFDTEVAPLTTGYTTFFSSPKRPDRLWHSPSLLFNRYLVFSREKNGRGMKLTTHLHLVPRLRMSGATPLLPHGVDRDNFLLDRHAEVNKFPK